MIFWMLSKKRNYAIPSLCILLLNFLFFDSFFKVPYKKGQDIGGLTILSYNVRAFDLYDWIPEKDTGNQIVEFTLGLDPDILVFQEFDCPGACIVCARSIVKRL